MNENSTIDMLKESGICPKCGNFECSCEEETTETTPEETTETTPELTPEKQIEAVQKEQESAHEDFSKLIDAVNERYADMAPEMRKTFIEHNADILNSTVELGIKKGLSKEELKLAEIAAIVHDMTKAEPDREGISNYTLAAHGETAAEEVNEVVTDEMLEKAGIDTSDKTAVAEAKNKIKDAVRQHMGPHPGFMDGILASVNASIEAKNKELVAEGKEPVSLIEHPKAEGTMSETVLAADMGSLASRAGREKVMAIRSNVPFFAGQDQAAVATYEDFGIDLKPGEAALLSGFDSGWDSHDMLPAASDQEWINKLIDQSKEKAYTYTNPDTKEKESIVWSEAMKKRLEFLPQWIDAEETKIAAGEYEGKDLETKGKALERAKQDLERGRKELEKWEKAR